MSSLKDLYSSNSREISLRDEFIALEEGSSIGTPKFKTILLRLMRRDGNGNLIKCECVSALTGEPDKEFLCPICMGEGFKWDEVYAQAYRTLDQPKEVIKPAGLINTPLVLFYCKYNVPLTKDDKVVELVLDLEGKATNPPKRSDLYKVQHVDSLRLDNGRVEYLKIWTYHEDVKNLG